jgi:hypothetical protein
MSKRGRAQRRYHHRQAKVDNDNRSENCMYCVYRQVSTTKYGHLKLKCLKANGIIAVRHTDKELAAIMPPEWCPEKVETTR